MTDTLIYVISKAIKYYNYVFSFIITFDTLYTYIIYKEYLEVFQKSYHYIKVQILKMGHSFFIEMKKKRVVNNRKK